MTDANVSADAWRPALTRGVVAAAGILALLGAGALWWRFGEAVYLTSMMNAIIACF